MVLLDESEEAPNMLIIHTYKEIHLFKFLVRGYSFAVSSHYQNMSISICSPTHKARILTLWILNFRVKLLKATNWVLNLLFVLI